MRYARNGTDKNIKSREELCRSEKAGFRKGLAQSLMHSDFMKKTELLENEHIEYLNKNFGMIVSAEHTFGTDALLLASFSKPKKNHFACDLGTGCGIIPLLWCRDGLCREISAVEIQKKGCDQLKRSITANSLENKLAVYNIDLKTACKILPSGKFDLVTMNPPYKGENAGIKSEKEYEKIARHETLCTLDDICLSAARLLRFGGRFCVCIRPERLFETMYSMKKQKIEPKKLRLVSKRTDCAPWLCLIEGKLGGKNGITVLKNLFVYKDSENLSDDMLEILGKYREDI